MIFFHRSVLPRNRSLRISIRSVISGVIDMTPSSVAFCRTISNFSRLMMLMPSSSVSGDSREGSAAPTCTIPLSLTDASKAWPRPSKISTASPSRNRTTRA
jgi:hypothetical protein